MREAEAQNIPIIAITDSNVDIRPIAYPIPANDDAINSVKMILKTITEAIVEAKNASTNPPEAAPEVKP